MKCNVYSDTLTTTSCRLYIEQAKYTSSALRNAANIYIIIICRKIIRYLMSHLMPKIHFSHLSLILSPILSIILPPILSIILIYLLACLFHSTSFRISRFVYHFLQSVDFLFDDLNSLFLGILKVKGRPAKQICIM